MKENKLVTQTVYLPGENNNSICVIFKKSKTIYVLKKENQIVLSTDEFRSILAEAQGYAYACGLERISVRKSKKLSDTYIDNLLQL